MVRGKDWDVLVEGLKTYRQKCNERNFISNEYVIPSTANFPSHLHGIELGRLLQGARRAFRNKKLTTFQIDALEEYHMHWDYETYRLKCVTLPALDMYKKVHGDVRVPLLPSYVIPSEQPWPEYLWGMKLGVQVKEWRTHKNTLSSHVVQALNERKFIWDVYEEDFQTITLPALKKYGELKGNLLVPRSFQVPATAQWPKSTHGYKLGQTVCNLRGHRGVYSAKDDLLDAINFIWDSIRYQFETRMLPACKIFIQQKGDLNTILNSFKVPKTLGLYPIACHGYQLGNAIHTWRLKGARSDLLEEIKAD